MPDNESIEYNILPVKYAALKCLAIFLAGFSIAIWLYLKQYMIGVGIAILLTSIFLLVISLMRRGICPTCQKEMSGFLDIDCCSHCGAYAQIVDNQLKPVGKGFIALIPRFKSHFWDLKHPSLWKLPWREKCCVCGAIATSFTSLEIRITKGVSGVVLTMVEKNIYTFEIGYCCKDHKNGVECENLAEGMWPQDKDDDNEDALLFRSYDYWQEFKTLNGKI